MTGGELIITSSSTLHLVQGDTKLMIQNFNLLSLAEKLREQKSRLSRTRTLVRREDGSTEVEENGIRVAEEPENVASTK